MTKPITIWISYKEAAEVLNSPGGSPLLLNLAKGRLMEAGAPENELYTCRLTTQHQALAQNISYTWTPLEIKNNERS